MTPNDNKKKILVVDDSTIYLEMMGVLIGDVYDLKYATDGAKALNMLKNEKDVALVLLDLVMPYMSGAEFLAQVKKDGELKNIPVIVLASSDDNEAACLNLGAVDFIKKPFPVRSAVLAKIENALSNKNAAKGIDFDSYVNALFSEYQTVYLVDAVSNSYDSISEDENYKSLNLKQRGENFYEDVLTTIKRVIYPEDRDLILNAFDKETFLTAVQSGLAMSCRIVINGAPKHYRIKAMYVPDENPQIIIGIANTEEEVVGMETLKALRNDPRTFADIAQSLVSDFMCIYYVHLESNRFIEYSSVAEYERLRLQKEGDNFFAFGLKSFIEGVNPVDKSRVTRQFTKENVLKTINEHKAFSIQFRLTFEDSDAYVSLKAVKLVKNGVEYLVVGIRNIDAQMNAQ